MAGHHAIHPRASARGILAKVSKVGSCSKDRGKNGPGMDEQDKELKESFDYRQIPRRKKAEMNKE
jgi:hypothetical protein